MTPYENLANAVIMQAVRDYRKCQNPGILQELEQFFLSDWFMMLTKVDGTMILERLRKEKRHDSKRILKSSIQT